MKTTPVTAADLAASVLSVPPLPRDPAGAIDDDETVHRTNVLNRHTREERRFSRTASA